MRVDYDKDQLAYALANALKERGEAREALEFRRDLYKVLEKYLETACRERDEARDAIVGLENKWRCAVDMAARAELERNEAQEKYATEATEHMLAVNKLANERDEAREALMKIEDLFIDGTDIYADREKMGTIARNALEETK